MPEESKEILRDLIDALQKVLEYQYASIDSLSDKAARFLSFSLIIDGLLAGYVGIIFLLGQQRFVVTTMAPHMLLYLATGSLISAMISLLTATVFALRSQKPAKISLPMSEDIEDIQTLHVTFQDLTEWYVERRNNLVKTIDENARICHDQAKSLRRVGILTIAAVIFLIAFIISTFVFALISVTFLNPSV